MNLAVLKYEFVVGAPEGIPNEWPAEIIELGDGTSLPGEDWVLMTSEELLEHKSEYQADYDTWYENYNPSLHKVIEGRIVAAEEFGSLVLREYARDNILAGLTNTEIYDVMQRCQYIYMAIKSGALYVALDLLDELETDESVITEDRVTVVRNKIQTFLGLDLT